MSTEPVAEVTPATVLAALQPRVGAANGISAQALVLAITGRECAADERRLRDCVTLLRIDGHAICAHPAHGYFIAAHEGELDDTCRFLFGRAMTGLQQVSALKKKALPDLAGQLGIAVEPAQEHTA